tara:strand:+ start:691 stop:1119 length:429 start_codon:yes stop_codon:yes gene_type:complete
MENSINLSILLPAFPLGMTIFIFILLRSFNRTINRLTKPVSFLLLFSIIISALLSLYFLINNVDGDISLSHFLSIFQNLNLEIHLNKLTEEIIFSIGIISSLIILYSLVKLPRQNGYILYLVNIGLITSVLISASLLFNLNT